MPSLLFIYLRVTRHAVSYCHSNFCKNMNSSYRLIIAEAVVMGPLMWSFNAAFTLTNVMSSLIRSYYAVITQFLTLEKKCC